MFAKLIKFMFSIYIASTLVGCASVNSVSLTPIPVNRSRPVSADVSRWIFLGFNFNNDYIDPLVVELKKQCPEGIISGILTKDETIAYFLFFKKHISTTGYCSSEVAESKTSKNLPKDSGAL